MEKSRGVFVKRAVKSSMGGEFKRQGLAGQYGPKRNKENTKPVLFGARPIDKQAIFQELQHVKDEILELQDRNLVLSEQNAYLQKQLLHTQPLNNSNPSTSKTHLRQAVIRQIQQLKQKSHQQSQQLQKLKRSPKYTTFLELQIEKNVCLEQLQSLRNRLREQSQEKKARRRCRKEMRRKVEEREMLIQRMRENITRENGKLRALLDTLVVNNTAGEGKLRELQLRNARYRSEIQQLQKDLQHRLTQQPTTTTTTKSTLNPTTKNICLQIALRSIKLKIPFQQVQSQIKSVLLPSKFDSFDGKAIGYENYEQLKKHIKCERDIAVFLEQVRRKVKVCQQVLQGNLMKSEDRARIVRKLRALGLDVVSVDKLREVLKELGVGEERMVVRIVLDSMICEDGLLKKLRVQSIIENLSEKGNAAAPSPHSCPAPCVVSPGSTAGSKFVEPTAADLNPFEKKAVKMCVEEIPESDKDDKVSMQNAYQNTRKDDEENYEDDFEDGLVRIDLDKKKKKTQEVQDQPEYDDDYQQDYESQFNPSSISKIKPQNNPQPQSQPYQPCSSNPPTSSLLKPTSSVPIIDEYQQDFSQVCHPVQPSIKHMVEQPKPDPQFYHKIYRESFASLAESLSNISNKSIKEKEDLTIAKLVSREFKKIQETLISERVISVKKIGDSVLDLREEEQILASSREVVEVELQYQCCLEAKAMLESLYVRLLDQQQRLTELEAQRRCSQQAKQFLESLYEQLQEKLESLENQRASDQNIRNFIGSMYKKITNQAVMATSNSSIESGSGEGRTSLFIEQYLKAFETNFSFT